MSSVSARKLVEYRSQLLLRIKHPTLDPDEITRELALEPEHVARVGASISAKGKQSLNSESYWLATLPTLAIPFIENIRSFARSESKSGVSKETLESLAQSPSLDGVRLLGWLKKLEAHRTYLHTINQGQGTITLVVQRANRKASFTVSHLIARKLADLGISLEID